MPQYDEPLEFLQKRQPSAAEPSDLWAFWQDTLADSRRKSFEPSASAVDHGLQVVRTDDVLFAGYDGEPVRAWLNRPSDGREIRGTIVRYVGYGSGRGLPHQVSQWSLAGFAELVMDTRGQGAGGGYVGDTADSNPGGVSFPGFMTRGIESAGSYYYRRVFTDATLAVDAARLLVGRDVPTILAGESQGGGIALAVAALADEISAVMADVPFLCDFPRAVALAQRGPYLEITGYLATNRWAADIAFNTLKYFDAALLSRRATAPALLSVALSDTICPPSTVYAAINSYGGPVDVRVYPFNDHEGGQFHQQAEQLRWLPEALKHLSPDQDSSNRVIGVRGTSGTGTRPPDRSNRKGNI